MLPLYPGANPCVGSGFCCKSAPCPFGKRTSVTDPSCAYLVQIQVQEGNHPRYTCGIYEYIITQPGWETAPAFGAGCCSALFNEDRSAIIRDIRNSIDPNGSVAKHHRKYG